MPARSSFPGKDPDVLSRGAYANGTARATDSQRDGNQLVEDPRVPRLGQHDVSPPEAEQATTLSSTFGIIEKLSKQISKMMRENGMVEEKSPGRSSKADPRSTEGASPLKSPPSPETMRSLVKDSPGARPRHRASDEPSDLLPVYQPSSQTTPAFALSAPTSSARVAASQGPKPDSRPMDFAALATPPSSVPLQPHLSASTQSAVSVPAPSSSRLPSGSTFAQTASLPSAPSPMNPIPVSSSVASVPAPSSSGQIGRPASAGQLGGSSAMYASPSGAGYLGPSSTSFLGQAAANAAASASSPSSGVVGYSPPSSSSAMPPTAALTGPGEPVFSTSPYASLRRSRGSPLAQSVPELRGVSLGLPMDPELNDPDEEDDEHFEVNGIRVGVDALPKRSPNLRKGSLTAQRAMLGQSIGSPPHTWRSPGPANVRTGSPRQSQSGSSQHASNDVSERLFQEAERYRKRMQDRRDGMHRQPEKRLGEYQMAQLTTRLLGSVKTREANLEKERKKREAEELKELKPTPTINPRSRLMAEHHNSLRDEIVRSTAERMDRLRREREERELCELRPAPMISARSKQLTRNVQDWVAWDEQRRNKIAKLREDKAAKEAAPLVFKPKLNYRSRLIASRGQEIQEMPVEDRLLADYHIRQIRRQRKEEQEKAQAKFAPEINEHSKQLQREGPETIFDRLYQLGVDRSLGAGSPRRHNSFLQSYSSTPHGPAVRHSEGGMPRAEEGEEEDAYPLDESTNELRVDSEMLELLASIGQPMTPPRHTG